MPSSGAGVGRGAASAGRGTDRPAAAAAGNGSTAPEKSASGTSPPPGGILTTEQRDTGARAVLSCNADPANSQLSKSRLLDAKLFSFSFRHNFSHLDFR